MFSLDRFSEISLSYFRFLLVLASKVPLCPNVSTRRHGSHCPRPLVPGLAFAPSYHPHDLGRQPPFAEVTCLSWHKADLAPEKPIRVSSHPRSCGKGCLCLRFGVFSPNSASWRCVRVSVGFLPVRVACSEGVRLLQGRSLAGSAGPRPSGPRPAVPVRDGPDCFHAWVSTHILGPFFIFDARLSW